MLNDALKKKLIESAMRVENYYWTQVQTNFLYNNYGRFIFDTFDYEELLQKAKEKMEEKKLPQEFLQYTINRWYNYITSVVICDFFGSHQRVKLAENKKDLYVDFLIDGNPFDLKVTFVPKAWSLNRVLRILRDPRDLITYYYKSMGADRAHYEAKIFLVMVDLDNIGKHPWQMKRQFTEIAKLVKLYLEKTRCTDFFRNFNIYFKGTPITISAADIIFLVKKGNNFYYVFYVWKDNSPKALEGKL